MTSIEKTLLFIHEKLKDLKIKWRISGSTSLYLQGADVNPKDIDIMTTKGGAYKIEEMLKDYMIKPVEFSRTEKFASYFGKLKINNIEVEIIEDLEVNNKGKWIKRKVIPHFVNINLMNKKLRLPLTSLAYHLRSYKQLNREKDLDKVNKIKQMLK